MIKEIQTVSSDNVRTFNNELAKEINDMQVNGLIVEVQYQLGQKDYGNREIPFYTALVIGKEKPLTVIKI